MNMVLAAIFFWCLVAILCGLGVPYETAVVVALPVPVIALLQCFRRMP